VLSTYPDSLSQKAKHQLERLGVEVRVDAVVTHIDKRGICVGDGRIDARTVLWAAGVAASELGASLGAPLDKSGRVIVNPDLTISDRPEIYVIGDLAHFEQDEMLVPGVAPAAIQEGRHAAANIRRAIEGKILEPFRYVDRGSMATLGRRSAVGVLGGVRLSGLVAWFAWLFIHIMFLIGFRNRLVVMFEWSKSYFTFQRSARLILHDVDASQAQSVDQEEGVSD
jgi:NADH dehydrogenase